LLRSPNLLLDLPPPDAPNKVIVGDITYLPAIIDGYEDWLYLAIWMDLFSRKIAGWEVDEHMDESLVIRPFKQVIRDRQPAPGMIVHSDGGGQYASINFRALLTQHGFRQSMTRKPVKMITMIMPLPNRCSQDSKQSCSMEASFTDCMMPEQESLSILKDTTIRSENILRWATSAPFSLRIVIGWTTGERIDPDVTLDPLEKSEKCLKKVSGKIEPRQK